MKSTIKEATVKRLNCGSYDQFRKHLADFQAARNLGSVDVHLVLITDAASETNAVTLSSVLQ